MPSMPESYGGTNMPVPLLALASPIISAVLGGGAKATPATSGDASSGFDAFSYASPFIVGGSGKLDATTSQTQDASKPVSGAGIDPALILYGVAGIGALLVIYALVKK